ncbi:hypothetical protein [Actomonas aquatica]|uniref:Uncharacterized protein n=1 Tax=Actomonas aquatica TaxID=2866162 RepID=A0ABZ1CD16_9BACT|nr:hypothetical protein [Opitutus sp. WL0086]WRQ89373.1 hypothetical protein K1X11_008125 [Opitutus sp. WL0086]
MTASEVPPELILEIASCFKAGGFAFRAGPHATIEFKSHCRDTLNQWIPAKIIGDKTHFASSTDRDEILNALHALNRHGTKHQD